jgi:putative ABC transport system substrate-binding protein
MQFDQLKRREFMVVVVAGGIVGWPLVTNAQQPGKLPTIGFAGSNASVWTAWTAAFVDRLRALGWIEGRTVAIQYRWTEGRLDRIAEIAAEFIRLKVDLIVTSAASAAVFKEATSVIPIVFVLGIDPIGDGLVTSLARPGGNITGLSVQDAEIGGKRLELLHEVVPHLRRLAVMVNVANRGAVIELGEVQGAAQALGLEIVTLEIRRAEDIASAFAALKPPADALYVVGDTLLSTNTTRVLTFANTRRLPTSFNTRTYVQAGALMSYGTNFSDQFRRAAEYVDKILRGTKPGDIPVEQPTKFELVVNLTTAKALDLTIPESLLARADEVIE